MSLIEHISFFQWLLHPVIFVSLVLCGWLTFSFIRAYRKTGRKRYISDGAIYVIAPLFSYILYTVSKDLAIIVSMFGDIGLFLALVLPKPYDPDFFEYRSIRSIFLFRDPDNVQPTFDLNNQSEKGLFVPHAAPLHVAQRGNMLTFLIGITLIMLLYALYFN